jgi:hypothetical protein
MAPKKAPEPEPVVNKAPEPGEVKYPEWTEAVLAAEPFALDAPFEDPAGLLLPADLYAGGEITWLRPSQFLPEGAVPCVVEQPAVAEGVAPPPPPRAMPNKLAVGTQLVPGAAPVANAAGGANAVIDAMARSERTVANPRRCRFMTRIVRLRDEALAAIRATSPKTLPASLRTLDRMNAKELCERVLSAADVKVITGDVKQIVGDVKKGKGTVGQLLNDPTVYEDLKLLLGNVRRNDAVKSLVRYAIEQEDKKSEVEPKPKR